MTSALKSLTLMSATFLGGMDSVTHKASGVASGISTSASSHRDGIGSMIDVGDTSLLGWHTWWKGEVKTRRW